MVVNCTIICFPVIFCIGDEVRRLFLGNRDRRAFVAWNWHWRDV
jgi:hypothetical protein